MKYYCKCLNICVELDSEAVLPDEPLTLSEEEKKDQFFAKLPLLVVRDLKVKKQQPMLIRSKRIGSWEVYKCTNCSTFSHAIENENSNTKLLNKALSQLSDSEVQNIKNSVDYSPVFHIVVADTALFGGDLSETSQLNGNFSNDIVELQKQLSDYVDEKNRITDENIRTYVEQQQSALKKLLKRANEDFQILTNVIALTDEPGMKRNNSNEVNSFNNVFATSQAHASTPPINISRNSVINDFDHLSISPSKGSKRDSKNIMMSGIPPSFDAEGLFPLDGMEEPIVLEEDEHSEEDHSDTDDSGSRDEGIHIPRRKTFAIAKSLPIRVPGEYDPSFRDVGEAKRFDKRKPNYQQKRNKEPLDIAASIKALANSVHGDTIFGDLPPPRIGSRI